MNGTDAHFLIDTNIIIYYLAGDPIVTDFLKQYRERSHRRCSVYGETCMKFDFREGQTAGQELQR